MDNPDPSANYKMVRFVPLWLRLVTVVRDPKTFFDIASFKEFFSWCVTCTVRLFSVQLVCRFRLRGVFLVGALPAAWYNGRPFSINETGYILHDMRIVRFDV